MYKLCFKCKNIKSIENFEKSKQNKDGFKSYCQICRVEYDRIKRIERKAKNPEKYKTLERDRKLRLKYNITLEEYNQMLLNQKYVCDICKKSYKDNIKNKLFVDHCHNTGKIRGLLCNSCNKGLGDFKDSVKLLNSAIKYLKK